jgi:hypothetical protein
MIWILTITLWGALAYYLYLGRRNALRIKQNYDSAMMRVVVGDMVVFFQGHKMAKGEVIAVLPDLVQVLTLDRHLVYIERSKITAICLS